MVETKGGSSSLKLFGMTIEVAAPRGVSPEGRGEEKHLLIENPTIKLKAKTQDPTDPKETNIPPRPPAEAEHVDDNNPPDEEEITMGSSPKSDENQHQKSNQPSKHLKKPTKILSCPRCHSVDTKFCYFNNYNVNQPRHFCKACQRYWTDGGTMRCMEVGAGRRKSKASSSHYGQMTILSSTLEKISSSIQEPFDHHEPAQVQLPVHGSNDQGSICFYLVDTYHPGLVHVPYTAPSTSSCSSSSGKHSREGDSCVETCDNSDRTTQEKGRWMPKTLRIDDPIEASRSSIWTTVKNRENPTGEFCFRGLFDAFQRKEDIEDRNAEISNALNANPSALWRSLEFHESIQWRKEMEVSRQM